MVKTLSRLSAVLCFAGTCILAAAAPSAAPVPSPTPAELTADLASFESHVTRVAESVLPATVGISIGPNEGTGVIVSPDGYVLTVGHVFSRRGGVAVVRFPDGTTSRATPLNYRGRDDYGLLKIEDNGPWPYVPVGSLRDVPTGDICFAVGYTGGFDRTRGAVLRIGRLLNKRGRFLRTDCAINKGDSGGPLFDVTGRLIGIHSRIYPPISMNLHVPIDKCIDDWEWLVGDEFPEGPVLGISGRTTSEGFEVEEVRLGMPAHEAGLEPGDLIRSVGGLELSLERELPLAMRGLRLGESLRVEVSRDGFRRTLDVMLDDRTAPAPAVTERRSSAEVQPLLDYLRRGGALEQAFQGGTGNVRSSVVEIRDGWNRVGLGTIVDAGGLVLAKASSLPESPRCELPGGRIVEARVVAIDDDYDLALLEVDAGGLVPASFDVRKRFTVGQLLASAGPGSAPVGVGVTSAPPLRIPHGNAWLGIEMDPSPPLRGGVLVKRVVEGGAAEACGLLDGDRIVAIDGKSVRSMDDCKRLIGKSRPGSTIELTVDRDRPVRLKAVLHDWPGTETYGGVKVSTRRSGFPLALQHDTPLDSDEIGGPLVDVRGRVVGINIARAGRTKSLAIPAVKVVVIVEQLKKKGRVRTSA